MGESAPQGRGRPPQDYSKLVGTTIRQLYILGAWTTASGPVVRASCLDCGTETEARLRDIRSGHTKTCGCRRAEVYRQLCEQRVDQLSDKTIARIWAERFEGSSRLSVSTSFKLPVGVVDFASRKYQRILDSMAADERGRKMVRMAFRTHSSIDQTAAEFGLSFPAARYVIQSARRQARTRSEDLNFLAQAAEFQTEKVLSRIVDWKNSRPREFGRKELKRVKGRVIGSMADLYVQCVAALDTGVPTRHRRQIQDFVSLAEETFEARLQRQDAKRKQVLKERDAKSARPAID